jgi:hypothetical protein
MVVLWAGQGIYLMKTARLQFFAMVDDISLKKGTMKVYKLKKKV